MIVSVIAARLVSKLHGRLFGQCQYSSPLAKRDYRGSPPKIWLKPL
jgi:hypothetical protein